MAAEASCYFALFELDECLVLEASALEARYHALARAHHPDRFATQGAELQAEAAARMELVNRAYRTLKDPMERLRYVLGRHGVTPAGDQLPEALADSYFELQEDCEALAEPERREEAIARLMPQRAQLKQLAAAWDERLDALARAHDALDDRDRPECRLQLAGLMGEISYLRAMRRDLDGRFMQAGL